MDDKITGDFQSVTETPDGWPSPNAHNAAASKAERRDILLHLEYQRAVASSGTQFDRILRVAGIGFSAVAALLFLVANNQVTIGEWTYWIAPIMLTLLYAIVINLLYGMSFSSYYTRQLEDEIATSIGYDKFHYENTAIRALSSIRTAHPPALASYALILLFACAFYATVVALCFVRLLERDLPIWREAAFLLLHGTLTIALLWSASGTTSSLRSQYDRWIGKSAAESPAEANRRGRETDLLAVVSYAILPRRFDFVFKSLFTVGALVVTAYVLGIPFDDDLLWTGLWVVFCVDFLAKQATYIWNDLLDVETDRVHPYKSGTRLLGRLRAVRLGKLLFVGRAVVSLIAALALAADLGLGWLPWLVVFVFTWQFLYDRWAKRGPVRRVIVAALGYGERAAAGALAAMSVAGEYDVALLILLAAWIVVFMAMVLAEFWWAERGHVFERWSKEGSRARPEAAPEGPAVAARPAVAAGNWFAARGRMFEKTANAVLLPVGFLLALLYGWVDGDRSDPLVGKAGEVDAALADPFSDASGWVIDGTGWLWRQGFDREVSRNLALALAAALCLAGMLAVYQLRRRMNPGKRIALMVGLLAAMALAVVIAPNGMELYALVFFLPLVGAANYERLSYKEIIALDRFLNERVKVIAPALDHALFRPWAIRVCVTPISSPASDARRDEWAETIRRMYEGWCEGHRVPAYRLADDGREGEDLIVDAWHSETWALLNETGRHVRQTRGPVSGEGDTAATEDVVRIDVLPLSVSPKPGMGSGLDLPDFAKLDREQPGPARRTYSRDGDDPVVEIADLGERRPERSGDVLDGDIDQLLRLTRRPPAVWAKLDEARSKLAAERAMADAARAVEEEELLATP